MRYAVYVSGRAGRPCEAARFCNFLRQADLTVRSEFKLVFADECLSAETSELVCKCGIDVCVCRFSELSGETRAERNRILSDRMNEALKRHEIDYCFSFGSHILSGPLLEDYKWRLINFHPAVLPMFPGNLAIDQAVAHGNALVVGNTCHFIDAGVDTGPIIMQSIVPLKTFFNHDGDYSVILDQQVELLNRLIRVIDNGWLEVVDGKPVVRGADYDTPHFFPGIECD